MNFSFRRREAFSLLELTVVAALLAVLLSIITQTLGALERNMRRTDDRARAVRCVENLMEQFTLGAWDDINDRGIRELVLPEELQQRWPRAKLTGEVVAESEPVAGKRVTLRLDRGTAARNRAVTLTAWVYQAPEAE